MYTQNRARLASQLPTGAIAVVNANDVLPSNSDGHLPYKANSDLLYLTGVSQEESILLLFPNAPDGEHTEVLFLRETSDLIAKWDGPRLTKEHARQVSGIKKVYWTAQFWEIFRKLATDAEFIYLNTNEHKRAEIVIEDRATRFVRECQRHYPLHTYRRLAPLLMRQRSIKQAEEIEKMQKAADLTVQGYKRLLSFIKPGVNERELQAELAHEFIRGGSSFADYQPILAGGKNATILHYIKNDAALKDGELILMDFAAGWQGYNADMTRVIPVSGRFTERQKDVYYAVLRVLKASSEALKPGLVWKDWQRQAEDMLEQECVKLGLIKPEQVLSEADRAEGKTAPFRKYFMHGLGHFLGLDVHDVGYFHEPFQVGQVLTVEPGLYIEEEGIGIRLENNLLITETGTHNLLSAAPLEVEDIEAAMASR